MRCRFLLFRKASERRALAGTTSPSLPYHRIEMRRFEARLHRDLGPTELWGYDGTFPGPTIESKSGEGFLVEWVNRLPATHLLPLDQSLHGAESAVPGRAHGRARAWRESAAGKRRLSGGVVRAGRVGALSLSERAGRGDALVSRSRARHHAPQRLRRPARRVHRARRCRGRAESSVGRVRDPADLLRPHVREGRPPFVSGVDAAGQSVGAGIFRQRDPRQRQAVSASRCQAAQIPPARDQRIEQPLLSLQVRQRHALPPDRHRTRACSRRRCRCRRSRSRPASAPISSSISPATAANRSC